MARTSVPERGQRATFGVESCIIIIIENLIRCHVGWLVGWEAGPRFRRCSTRVERVEEDPVLEDMFGYFCAEYCFFKGNKREEQLSDLHSSRLLLREPSEDKAGQGTNQGWHAVG